MLANFTAVVTSVVSNGGGGRGNGTFFPVGTLKGTPFRTQHSKISRIVSCLWCLWCTLAEAAQLFLKLWHFRSWSWSCEVIIVANCCIGVSTPNGLYFRNVSFRFLALTSNLGAGVIQTCIGNATSRQNTLHNCSGMSTISRSIYCRRDVTQACRVECTAGWSISWATLIIERPESNSTHMSGFHVLYYKPEIRYV